MAKLMANILDIYKEYNIMPNLIEHQLRVAGVAYQIIESCKGRTFTEKERQNILTACLLHDMGNIIKSNLMYFPEMIEPEGLEYWQKVKDNFIAKYGDNEDKATYQILKELHLEDIVDLVKTIGFEHIFFTNDSSIDKKIVSYADFRVSPNGVVSIADRLKEARERKKFMSDIDIFSDDREEKDKCLYKIEEQIFSELSILPTDITDESIAQYIQKLKEFEI